MYHVDFPDDDPGTAVTWTLTPDGGITREEITYQPTFYVSAPSGDLTDAATLLKGHPRVEALTDIPRDPDEEGVSGWRAGWRYDYTPVLAVQTRGLRDVDELARTLSQEGRPGTFRLFNVDLSREFRYCLETQTDPTPQRTPRVLQLQTPGPARPDPHDPATVSTVIVGDTTIEDSPSRVADRVADHIEAHDPDILHLHQPDLIPTLFEASSDPRYQLGREPGYQQLANRSTFSSYGQVGHSPARYNLPGRVIIDESNTFWLDEANLEGIIDLTTRSWKPLQEAAWGSIGNLLTAIQIRYARDHDVLVPWRSWRHEQFKSANTLDRADRGGFTFAPDVGVHETVHELDFSSLYPNIIRENNISPETVRCECHPDRQDVPDLGYSICPEPGYLGEVLGPIIDDRDDIKTQLRKTDDPQEIERLEGAAAALKWILVSCFGYQGFANAKFGRIECHEAINAYAREILLDAKQAFENHGWRVVHGIVDSVWVTARADADQTPLDAVADEITTETGIRLEYEAAYDWIAFCPRRNDDVGALTRYFGHKKGHPHDDPDAYKFRGIEARQRSTPPFFEAVQQELVATYSQTRSPKAVCGRLQSFLQELTAGDVDPDALAIRNRVSKPLDAYQQATRNVAALQRAETAGLSKFAGEDVEYVVVDDAKTTQDRVQLRSEQPTSYDVGFYREELIRVAESVLSPMGWREHDIELYLQDHADATLSAF